ncbi:hypothetical protein A6V39_01310 [Candidatus Mycoplasma haematobovis]|uniref:Uncharacterized protein n=1 Tax=Candidatus Mycoplasma haematobovis TaxID=432608 RepID=A0A1A9QDL6_9MOLU|nr:hypothetical protein [Candidatus Mycoplasma haematobovis]OAL10692.1 hypothetical protein A6V39_01310 [Candidatus Mycoplasma haematobovis]
MTLPTKIGLGALTVGTISGISYAGSTYFVNNESKEKKDEQQGTTIKALIDKEYKHILLSTVAGDSNTDKEHWKTAWATYQSQNSTNEDIFKLDGWATRNNNDFTEKLKAKCGELIDTTVPDHNDTNYQNVTKYCARNVTIKDQAGKEQLKVIDTKGNDSLWTEKVQNKANLTTHFNNLEIRASSGSEITASDIKGGCEKAVTRNTSQDNYDNAYNSYKEVCANKG